MFTSLFFCVTNCVTVLQFTNRFDVETNKIGYTCNLIIIVENMHNKELWALYLDYNSKTDTKILID